VYYPMDHFWIPVIQYLLPQTPHILTLHDPKQHQGERNLLLEFFSAQSIKRSSGIVILSSVFKENIRAMGFSDEQIAVIPHGEFSSYSRGRGSDLLPTEGTLLFFGRISEYKGVGVLLDAFARIASERPSAKLLMAGSGELEKYRRKIEVIPTAQIEIVNKWIADEEIDHYFSRASFVVLPYIDGTQSGVIAAAYGFGLPVIASRVGGLSEQVVDGVTGFLVEPSNIDELVDRCLQLIDNPDVVKRMGDNAYAVTQDELSWDTLSKKLSQFLERFI
jgi:glycosyltransferase involved in cell wall biosynthesis